MQVRININAVGDSIDSLIDKKLEESKVPGCFGKLGIPIIRDVIRVEVEDVFKKELTTQPSEVAVKDIAPFLVSKADADLLTGFIIDNAGLHYIEKYKKDISDMASKQLMRCS